MAERYTTADKAAIFMAFPDDLKKAIGEYEPLEAKTIEELHDILLTIRRKFDLAPWHYFTLYMKILGSAKRYGHPTEPWNSWTTFNHKHVSKFSNKSCQWIELHIEAGRGHQVGSIDVYVCPAKKIIWKANSEGQISTVLVPTIGEGGFKEYLNVPAQFVYKEAEKKLAILGESHGPVRVHYTVNTSHEQEEREPKSEPEKPGLGLRTVEAVIKHAIEKETRKEPPVEMLRTMFEIACVKLRELGMESTIERWSKQLNQYIGETP